MCSAWLRHNLYVQCLEGSYVFMCSASMRHLSLCVVPG